MPIVREPFTGAWQQNQELYTSTTFAYYAVFACATAIASDCAKVRLRLVEQIGPDMWKETTSPAFSPVLRKPNRYQTAPKFVESWMLSKLNQGNAYALKQRDARRVVTSLYVLNPYRVRPLVAPDGGVYYELQNDNLADLPEAITVPASEIIHDTMYCPFHPLCGIPPLYAASLAATQGLTIQHTSSNFFANGSTPGGIVYVPGAIPQPKADKLKTDWETKFAGDNAGKVAILADGMKYEKVGISAADAQLIEQLRWTAEPICSCYHVPPYMIGIGSPPPYNNVEPQVQQYYSMCLQYLMRNMEACLDEGLGLLAPIDGTQYGTEFDIDDLIWMDTATRTAAAKEAIGGGALSPNEARAKYYGMGPVPGGDSPMVQQQWYSLEALAKRDADQPFAKPAPATPAPAVTREALEAAIDFLLQLEEA